jgi:hypothetical protein
MLMVGCATRQPFVYSYPPLQKDAPANLGTVAIEPTKDLRTTTNELDQVLFLPQGLDQIVAREIESTGRFARIVSLTNGVARGNDDLLLDVKLNRLTWEIPRHSQIVGTVFVISLFTGGIGGIIYGSTSTDVLGHAELSFKLSNPSKSRVLLEGRYTGDIQEKVTKLSCDTPGTGRTIAGKAVKLAMEQFKSDLNHLTLNP